MSERADVSGAPPPPPPAELEPRPDGVERPRLTLRRNEARAGYALISPTLVIVIVMVVLPIIWTVSLAFQQIRLLNLSSAGIFGNYTIDNFRGIFTAEGFWTSLRTTLIYSVLGTASAIGLGLIAALALRKAFRGRTFVRAAMLLPYVAPSSPRRSPGARCSARSSAS